MGALTRIWSTRHQRVVVLAAPGLEWMQCAGRLLTSTVLVVALTRIWWSRHQRMAELAAPGLEWMRCAGRLLTSRVLDGSFPRSELLRRQKRRSASAAPRGGLLLRQCS